MRQTLKWLQLGLAFCSVIVCEQCLRILGFRSLCWVVRNFPEFGRLEPDSIDEYVASLSDAIDRVLPFAAIRTYCLSRSAAQVCLFRLYGIPAKLSIGVQQFPFAAHAWVDVNGTALADPFEFAENYAVLDRL
jgi:hypothetical protein